MVIRTPEVLRQKLNLPANAGETRALPRPFLTAYEGSYKRKPCKACRDAGTPGVCHHNANPEKFDRFITHVAMIMAGALPEDGGHVNWSKPATQADIAEMLGVRRETVTVRISRLANQYPAWDEETRRKMSTAMKARAALRGLRLRETRHRRRRNPHMPDLIHRKRRFAKPNSYAIANHPRRRAEWAVWNGDPETKARVFLSQPDAAKWCEEQNEKLSGKEKRYWIEERSTDRERFHYPTVDQLAADPNVGHLYNPEWRWQSGTASTTMRSMQPASLAAATTVASTIRSIAQPGTSDLVFGAHVRHRPPFTQVTAPYDKEPRRSGAPSAERLLRNFYFSLRTAVKRRTNSPIQAFLSSCCFGYLFQNAQSFLNVADREKHQRSVRGGVDSAVAVIDVDVVVA